MDYDSCCHSFVWLIPSTTLVVVDSDDLVPWYTMGAFGYNLIYSDFIKAN